ncbi:MAG: PKD domain-containing protein, partial [Methanomicrobiales archaeon]|nr:PKD domain-containing protein [Methanomicrobiales archaeon]
DGAPLTTGWPLQLVGTPLTKDDGSLGGTSVGKIAEIELTEFGTPVEAPTLHIVKYAEDRTTVVAEATLDYNEMMAQFDVIGDGTTLYKFQGVTMDPEDIWGETDETKGGFKVSNAVKGTRLVDLVGLVGDMGPGTDLVLVASDGYRTILPYTSVHTTPDIQARQGDAVLAWYADGKYVPGYTDGMRLFFMPDDHLYGQWDMHETLPPGYWHYFYQTYDPQDPEYGEYAPGILYPSAAGLSAKYVTEVRVYTTPETQWNLQLDGTSLGGMRYSVAKSYFEQALACQMGANHQMSYTDTSGNVWSGMPLWFLAGFVDDADQHSNNAFNDALAAAGYRVVVTADDGYSATLDSRLIGRNSNYLVANTLNGAAIPETDSSWPLRLVGTNVTGKTGVKGVAQIQLLPLVAKPVASFTAAPLIGDAPLQVQFTDTSTGEITAWAWDFGDGETSTDPSPDHTFTAIGVYSISLTVTGPGGSDTRTETEYITALRPIPDDLGAEEDTFIDSSYLTTNVYGRRIPVRDINYGSSTGLAVVRGSRDMAGYSNWRASLIRFDLEGLAGRTESGTLHLNRTTINSDWISIYRMNVPWEEMEATFNVPSDGAASWAGDWYPGGNYAAEPSDTVYVRGDEAWVEFDVSADMDAFAAGTPNYGWILRAADGSSSWSTVSFASGEAKEGYRPYMTFD